MDSSDLPPPVAMLQLITARWVSAAISVVAKLGVADAIASEPRGVDAIASAVGAHPRSLYRILRALASVGVFAEDDHGRFGHTPLSETLKTGPGTMRAMAVMTGEKPMSEAWAEAIHTARTGESAFEKVHGTTLFKYFDADPEFGRTFDDAMTSRSAMEARAVTAAIDLSGVKTLVDVAGGQGLLLSTLLAATPSLRGVLFDLASVVAQAGPILERAGVAARCEVVAGDFFTTMPRGDGYVMKHILHDWDDASCVRVLRGIRAAAEPGARLFVIDAVLGPGNAPHAGKILDLQMLVSLHGGCERTRAEWEALLREGGFALARIVDTRSPISILEATPT